MTSFSELRLREATAADVPQVSAIHVASWQDAYRGVVPDHAIDDRTIDGAMAMWHRNLLEYPGNLTVAEGQRGDITGFSCAGPVTNRERSGPYEFEVYALHVRPDIRGNGIGAALLRHAMDRTRIAGMHSLIVWTLKDLHLSRRFYQRQGGRLVKSGISCIGGIDLPDVAYGWQL